ncbi:MAG: NifU N-terminal domain-containing protein [Bdellovibrionales bacterium]|nr:NifU N-terminal domain-containing protein [Bdellovibrionales bacterium]
MSPSVEIRLEFTPNPNALKYVVDDFTFMSRGTASFGSKADASGSPLARRLLDIPGVAGCMIGLNFVTVTKTESGDWEVLDTRTRQVIQEHVASGEPAVDPLSLDKPMGTGRAGKSLGMMVLATMAAEAVARATVRAVLAAHTLNLANGLRLPCHADMVRAGS